ncbi:MBL fold metallo-hydrolase [Rhodospirillaceae bacterium AH-315-P19]|nr:MBL fold metallo-hydrolase [Rhodospirillaceae bacterium AH-315-P19]
MKITCIAHACLLIEAGGKKILTDPWILGPSWGGNLWVYPPAKAVPEDFHDVDVIYFSHAHEDHFQRECVARLPQVTKEKAKVLIPDFGMPYFEKAVKKSGFANVHVMQHEDVVDLAKGVRAHMQINDQGDHDSALILEADQSTLLLQTDSVVSIDEAERLGQKFDIDLLFAITILTGIYPAFCDMPAEQVIARAQAKRERSIAYALDVTRAMKAKAVVPYASDLCYLGNLYHINALHHHDKAAFLTEVAEKLPTTEGIRMTPGDWLKLEGGRVVARSLSDADERAEKLATFAIAMQARYERSWREEHSRTTPPFGTLVENLSDALSKAGKAWPHAPYRVLWRVQDADGSRRNIGHVAGALAEVTEDDAWSYDLRIDVQAFRLRRLAHGDYPMGFLTLQNGGLRFHRHEDELTPSERAYWQTLLRLRIPVQV